MLSSQPRICKRLPAANAGIAVVFLWICMIWYLYLFAINAQSSREELLEDIEELKKKISGAVEES